VQRKRTRDGFKLSLVGFVTHVGNGKWKMGRGLYAERGFIGATDCQKEPPTFYGWNINSNGFHLNGLHWINGQGAVASAKFPQKKEDGLGKGVFSEKSFSLNRWWIAALGNSNFQLVKICTIRNCLFWMRVCEGNRNVYLNSQINRPK